MSDNGNQVREEPNGLFRAIGTQKLAAIIALIVLSMFFWIFGGDFAEYSTLVSIFDLPYYIGFMTIGVTFIIIAGEIDLSIDTVCICCSLISRVPYIKLGLPVPPCVILAILMGGLFGLTNGPMVSVIRLPVFIAALGITTITRDPGSIVTNTATMTSPQAFASGGSFRGIFRLKGAGLPQAGIPTGFVLLVTPAILVAILLSKAHPRHYTLSLGSNKEATRLSDVNVVKWETLAYVISSLFVGLTGVSYAAIYSVLMPGIGNGFELGAIAGVVIGGTSLVGGVGFISGTLIGAFTMFVLKTGLPFVGVQPYYQLPITEFVLITAVFVNVLSRREQGKD